MSVKARLIRTDFASKPNRLCCPFLDMSEKDRNHIIQFVFEQQV